MHTLRWPVLRAVTLALAFVHAFPAQKHLALFAGAPSFGEAWKGFGALAAVALYLLPPRRQVALLAVAWRRARPVLLAAGVLLAVVHAVPALDHVPRFFAAPSWADAWRGFGATFAVVWMALPLELQAKLLYWAFSPMTCTVALMPSAPASSRAPRPPPAECT